MMVLVMPMTNEMANWLEENTNCEPWQWFGGRLVVEMRYAADLVYALGEHGFTPDEDFYLEVG